MLKALAAAITLLALGLTAHSAAAATLQAKATLQADKPGPVISRNLYGQFSEHLGGGIYDGIWVGEDSAIANVRGIRSDVVAALKAIKTPLVRWPGGCFADEYHWRDGIGPRGQRPVRKNNWWGGAPESNAFGTHEFMDFVEQIGAEAYVSVNVGSSTPDRDARMDRVHDLSGPGHPGTGATQERARQTLEGRAMGHRQ